MYSMRNAEGFQAYCLTQDYIMTPLSLPFKFPWNAEGSSAFESQRTCLLSTSAFVPLDCESLVLD